MNPDRMRFVPCERHERWKARMQRGIMLFLVACAVALSTQIGLA